MSNVRHEMSYISSIELSGVQRMVLQEAPDEQEPGHIVWQVGREVERGRGVCRQVVLGQQLV